MTHLYIVASVAIFIILASKFFTSFFQRDTRQFKTDIAMA